MAERADNDKGREFQNVRKVLELVKADAEADVLQVKESPYFLLYGRDTCLLTFSVLCEVNGAYHIDMEHH